MSDDLDTAEAWARCTSLGWILHMMSDVPTTPSLVTSVERRKRAEEKLGDALVRMRVITARQLDDAIVYQTRMRAARSGIDSLGVVAMILSEMRARRARETQEIDNDP